MKAPSRTRHTRLTEAFLLSCVLLVLFFGGLLATGGRAPKRATPPVQLNTASASELTKALEGDAALAGRIVAERKNKGAYSDVDALARRKLLSHQALRGVEGNLAVQTWGTARTQLWLSLIGLGVLFSALHFHLRRVFPKADPYLLPCAALLSTLGVLLLFGLKDPERDRLAFVAQTQGIWLGGLALLVTTLRPFWSRPLHRYGYVYALSALGLITLLGLFGGGQGGVKLNLLGFQPVEVVKVLLVFFLASYLADRGRALAETSSQAKRADLYPLLAMYALPLALFALLKDLGPALVLFGAFLALFYVVTSRAAFVWLGLVALGLGGWVGYVLHFGVFHTRVEMWLHPWDNTERGGDQLALGLWGMATGGPTGAGIGLGGTRFIPRGGSDLAFAALGEELGLLGPLAVCLCLIVLFWRGISIARRASSDFERYLAAGLASLIGVQGLVIVAGCLGLMPLTGISLPLVAFGKSSVVMTWFSVGLLAALSHRAERDAEALPPYLAKGFTHLSWALTVPLSVCLVAALAAQTVQANGRALTEVRVPDADGTVRRHRNPRLIAIGNDIPRGRLLDRSGEPLAETRDGTRNYPLGTAAVHVVGVLSPALGGPTGLEEELSAPLRGLKSWDEALALWRGKDLPGFALPKGKDVTVTLDSDLQVAAQKALVKWAGKVKDRKTGKPKQAGAAVVIDVATGGILAAATAPTYEPGKPIVNPALAPQLNRAMAGLYPPGSAFKPVTAAALLAAGKGEERFSGGDGGHETVWWKIKQEAYSRKVTNDEGEALGRSLTLSDALIHSSNIYFAHAGVAVGVEGMREMSGKFGLTHLPKEALWPRELADLSYGQGSLLVTPLELAGVAQTLANGGKRLRPHYVQAEAPEVLSTPLTPEQAKVINKALRGVTTRGTARGRFEDLPFTVAGKTGTAQTSNGDGMSHSWFIGFAPAENPKIAFAVIIENGGYGAKSAVPAVRDILRAWKR